MSIENEQDKPSEIDRKELEDMRIQDLMDYTKQEHNEENAKELLDRCAKNKYFIGLNQINSIVEYIRASGIDNAVIVDSLNENGFPVSVQDIKEDAFEQFRNFKLLGLKATSMHETIMQAESFTALSLITDIDKKDFTFEFRKIIQDLKRDVAEKRENNGYIPRDLDEYGEVEYIVLNWHNTSFMLKNLMQNVQNTVKSGLILRLNDFDKTSYYKKIAGDNETFKTIRVLAESMTLSKDDYISIYMKMLNRNYTLEEFQDFAENFNFFDREVMEEANFEISQNSYYPDPKNNWMDDRYNSRMCITRKRREIDIRKIKMDPKEIRTMIKDEVIKRGDVKRKKIKTDMTGRDDDGNIIKVDNLKDWLFGVPGTPGNLKIRYSDRKILLPPQTPLEAVNLIEEILNNRFYDTPNGVGEGR